MNFFLLNINFFIIIIYYNQYFYNLNLPLKEEFKLKINFLNDIRTYSGFTSQI